MSNENTRLVTITILSAIDEKGNAKFNVRWHSTFGDPPWRNKTYVNTNLAWMQAYWNRKGRDVITAKPLSFKNNKSANTKERQRHGSSKKTHTATAAGVHGSGNKVLRVRKGASGKRGAPGAPTGARQPSGPKRNQGSEKRDTDRVRPKSAVRSDPAKNERGGKPLNAGDKRMVQGLLC